MTSHTLTHTLLIVLPATDTNLTLADLFALPGLQDALNGDATDPQEVANESTSNATALTELFGPNLSTENNIKYCMAFTTEYSGESCLEINNILDGQVATTFSTAAQDCSLTYNGQSCSGCEFSIVDGGSCVTADCTGVAEIGTMVDSCAGTGLVGPMQYLDASAPADSTCGATQVTISCEGAGCDTAGRTDGSGAAAVSALWTAGVAAVIALMM